MVKLEIVTTTSLFSSLILQYISLVNYLSIKYCATQPAKAPLLPPLEITNAFFMCIYLISLMVTCYINLIISWISSYAQGWFITYI